MVGMVAENYQKYVEIQFDDPFDQQLLLNTWTPQNTPSSKNLKTSQFKEKQP